MTICMLMIMILMMMHQLQRRLMVITRRRTIQMWNFNTGELLDSIKPHFPVGKAGVSFDVNVITSANFDDAYLGPRKAQKKLILLGNDSGAVFCFEDLKGDVDSEPAFVLVQPAQPRPVSTRPVSAMLQQVLDRQTALPGGGLLENDDVDIHTSTSTGIMMMNKIQHHHPHPPHHHHHRRRYHDLHQCHITNAHTFAK